MPARNSVVQQSGNDHTINNPTELLTVQNLRVGNSQVTILNNISFTLTKGQTLGIVGESGSGKSTLARAILGLLPPGLSLQAGDILFQGTRLTTLSPKQIRSLRGRRIALIVQDPRGAINPLQTVGQWMQEVIQSHFNSTATDIRQRAQQYLKAMELNDVQRVWQSYPHQLSGGMLQRVLIATALSLEPNVLIADEPTTALDATVRRQIIHLLQQIQETTGLSMVIISHDFGVIKALCHETLVLYAGQMMEMGPTAEVVTAPLHPYTKGLLEAMPRLDRHKSTLVPIPGDPPIPSQIPHGCAFVPRCTRASDQCHKIAPLVQTINSRQFRCYHPFEKGMQ